MHTLVVSMTTDPARAADVSIHLRTTSPRGPRQQPGFVNGEWLLSEDRDTGLGFVVFDSAEAANQAATGPRRYARDDQRAWNITDVTVYKSVASAGR